MKPGPNVHKQDEQKKCIFSFLLLHNGYCTKELSIPNDSNIPELYLRG